MKKIINKYSILGLFVFIFIAVIAWININPSKASTNNESITVKKIANQILADGTVESKDTATLHFQVGGKLIYLPVKEGDKVYAGQIIAQLDSYALQRQVQIAANSYEIVKNSTDQTQESKQAGVLEGQQRYSLDTTSKQGYSAIPQNNLIYDNVQRIIANANLSQNSAQLNVDLANYALSLASLTSPINGVITKIDVSNINTNITSQTNFIVADPTGLVFNANVPETMINYISEGASAQIKVSNGKVKTVGTVTKIYPQKFTLSNGENVYKVEISASDLNTLAKMGQSGSVLINSNLEGLSMIVPTWSILGKKYVWVINNGQPILRTIKIGKVMGDETEVIDGLKSSDKVVLNPKSIAVRQYKIL
jgi:RND family efflux transporter MFP subunit